ncbi:Crp/Fnr family transcriptional regulator [Aquimarina macrocephali]|uniref:Crp/Fnr family transcriptional regulator n=1 Tax=Aquimarina macrocephali TaxID=666563 RepID=UPI000463E011|nr:Crp/Fnr family transcriptional regulator [Aquimarina macrocephali]
MCFELLNILVKNDQYNCNIYYQNEVIKSTGACSKKIYLIKNGVMKIGCFTDQGEEVVLIILTKNQVFGASSIFIDFCSYCIYESLSEETKVYEFDKNIIQKAIKKNPDLYKDFLSILGKEYQEYENRIKTLQIQSAELRLIKVLFEFKEKFGCPYNSEEIIIHSPLNQNELSNYIRVSRVTTNKIINKLNSNLLLEYSNKSIIIKKSFFDNYKQYNT